MQYSTSEQSVKVAEKQSSRKISRALISVTDKSGLVDLARGLAEFNVEILSTGGTARLLRESGIAVKDVSEITSMPEMLDGRVKTLHPAVHGGILALRSNEEHMSTLERLSIGLIDMVVVNLYQFEQVASKPGAGFGDIIENIDIGGPAMIRSAAKNFQDVAVVTSPEDYASIIEEMRRQSGSVTRETLWRLAQKAFATTARYDSAISRTLGALDHTGGKKSAQEGAKFPAVLELRYEKISDLRYGENPHQAAAVYVTASGPRAGIAGGRQLQGKELSFNNLVDLEAAWELVREFSEPATAIIKHTNPCGAAVQPTLTTAYVKALETDPVSAYGGVLGFNRPLDGETAGELAKTFVEAIVAPGFMKEALERLAKKTNLRLVEVDSSIRLDTEFALKQVSGGMLVQDKDHHPIAAADLKAVTARQPTEEEIGALLFAWQVVKHVKSNAIVFARDNQLVGVGAGQMSRVDSVKLAAGKAILPTKGTVMASDAFFPFPDGVEEAAKAGVVAVIQPGGSIRDQEVIEACNRLGLAMVFTGIRHFRH